MDDQQLNNYLTLASQDETPLDGHQRLFHRLGRMELKEPSKSYEANPVSVEEIAASLWYDDQVNAQHEAANFYAQKDRDDLHPKREEYVAQAVAMIGFMKRSYECSTITNLPNHQ